jgi:flagellar biosynthesis/type III secretory pathway M-ring protein FliF/YscJ
MATIWLLSLLPFLLLAALVLSIALIPVTRRLRREMEEAGYNVKEPRRSNQQRDLNITPWHRQLRNIWRDFSS